MKFYCIADEDTVRGFRLAGVAGCAVSTAEQAAAAFETAVAQPDHGILLLTEPVASAIRQQVDAVRQERSQPLIVEIPGIEGPLPGRKAIRQIVQEAVGIRIGSEGA